MSSGPMDGIYIAHSNADWVIDVDKFYPEDFDIEANNLAQLNALPDFSIDPETKLLTLINADKSGKIKSYFLTFCGNCMPLTGANGAVLSTGVFRDEHSVVHENYTTLIITLQSESVMDVCYVSSVESITKDLHSDIHFVKSHPNPDDFNPENTFIFPLLSSPSHKGFLCSQGVNDCFTHFFAETMHAFDFNCPVGTPIVAIGDAVVINIQQSNVVSGIHVKNLFMWNSISIKLKSNGNVVEYVHIAPNSCLVKVGDEVKEGHVMCLSGDVGFCPSPHLHIQMHESQDDSAITIKFALKSAQGSYYFPEKGSYYNETGLMEPSPAAE